MLRPVCVSCRREMTKVQSGWDVIEHMNNGAPYRVIAGDLFRCPGCGLEVISDFASQGAEHFEESFSRRLALARSINHVELADYKEKK